MPLYHLQGTAEVITITANSDGVKTTWHVSTSEDSFETLGDLVAEGVIPTFEDQSLYPANGYVVVVEASLGDIAPTTIGNQVEGIFTGTPSFDSDHPLAVILDQLRAIIDVYINRGQDESDLQQLPIGHKVQNGFGVLDRLVICLPNDPAIAELPVSLQNLTATVPGQYGLERHDLATAVAALSLPDRSARPGIVGRVKKHLARKQAPIIEASLNIPLNRVASQVKESFDPAAEALWAKAVGSGAAKEALMAGRPASFRIF